MAKALSNLEGEEQFFNCDPTGDMEGSVGRESRKQYQEPTRPLRVIRKRYGDELSDCLDTSFREVRL